MIRAIFIRLKFQAIMQKAIEDLLADYTASKAVLLTKKFEPENQSCALAITTIPACFASIRCLNLLEMPSASQVFLPRRPFICSGHNRPAWRSRSFIPTGQNFNLPTRADFLRLMWPLRGILCSPVALETQMWMAKQGLRTIAYEGGTMQVVGSFYSNITNYESL